VGRARRQTKPAAFLIATSLASTIGNLESLVMRSKGTDAGYNRLRSGRAGENLKAVAL
jgi:hypothetical protein